MCECANMQINKHVATDKLNICIPAYLHICTYIKVDIVKIALLNRHDIIISVYPL